MEWAARRRWRRWRRWRRRREGSLERRNNNVASAFCLHAELRNGVERNARSRGVRAQAQPTGTIENQRQPVPRTGNSLCRRAARPCSFVTCESLRRGTLTSHPPPPRDPSPRSLPTARGSLALSIPACLSIYLSFRARRSRN
jgi:hypothetical protein